MRSFINRAVRFVSPPEFESQETKTRNARLLYAIAAAVLVVATLYGIAGGLVNPSQAWTGSWIEVLFLYSAGIGALRLARSGEVEWGGALFLSAVWLLLSFSALMTGGLSAPVVSGYSLVIICAALILGRQQVLMFAGLSLLMEAGLAALYPSRLTAAPAATSPWLALGAYSAFLVMITLTLILGRESIERTLQRLYGEIRERRKVEQALRRSEARYKVISEISSDYTYEFAVKPSGQVELEWVTDSFVRLSGYDSFEDIRQLGGMPVLVHPADMPLVQRRIARLLEGHTDVSELRLRRKDGGTVWIRDFGRGIWSDQEQRVTGIVGAAQDITRRRQAQASMQRAHRELRNAYDRTIEGWVRMIDLRDRETQGHAMRVTDLAVRLAQELGVPAGQLVHVRRGALLHDIGKIAVPDRVLLKRGPLTRREIEIIRQHPDYAYQILSPIAYLRPALDIPYRHHERWDGSGYPGGLRGEEIPLAARLFAVVDVWDALCSDRPYRKGWAPDAVEAYLEQEAGRLFDPEAVAAFLAIVRAMQPAASG